MIMITIDFILISKKKKKRLDKSHHYQVFDTMDSILRKKKYRKQVVLKFSLSIVYAVEN